MEYLDYSLCRRFVSPSLFLRKPKGRRLNAPSVTLAETSNVSKGKRTYCALFAKRGTLPADRTGADPMSKYIAEGSRVYLLAPYGDKTDVAKCEFEDSAPKAADLLNRAAAAQEKHQYTKAARLNHQARMLPGFYFIGPFACAN